MEKVRILIVDDDPKLIRLVREVLSAAGYEVLTSTSGEAAIRSLALEQPQLVLLDILLPDLDGYQVARRAREFSNVPIIMLTARVAEKDKLTGFEAGADDYITKPFSSKELLVRVRAVLKRAEGVAPSSVEMNMVFGDVCIDQSRRSVTVAGREIHLTATEYKLLHKLAAHCDQVLMHEQLLTDVWGSAYRDDVDYLRSYVHNLRKKLERDPANPTLILNIQGVGYMLSSVQEEVK
jgi:two-component system KDP operon response regulator KdpE